MLKVRVGCGGVGGGVYLPTRIIRSVPADATWGGNGLGRSMELSATGGIGDARHASFAGDGGCLRTVQYAPLPSRVWDAVLTAPPLWRQGRSVVWSDGWWRGCSLDRLGVSRGCGGAFCCSPSKSHSRKRPYPISMPAGGAFMVQSVQLRSVKSAVEVRAPRHWLVRALPRAGARSRCTHRGGIGRDTGRRRRAPDHRRIARAGDPRLVGGGFARPEGQGVNDPWSLATVSSRSTSGARSSPRLLGRLGCRLYAPPRRHHERLDDFRL